MRWAAESGGAQRGEGWRCTMRGGVRRPGCVLMCDGVRRSVELRLAAERERTGARQCLAKSGRVRRAAERGGEQW